MYFFTSNSNCLDHTFANYRRKEKPRSKSDKVDLDEKDKADKAEKADKADKGDKGDKAERGKTRDRARSDADELAPSSSTAAAAAAVAVAAATGSAASSASSAASSVAGAMVKDGPEEGEAACALERLLVKAQAVLGAAESLPTLPRLSRNDDLRDATRPALDLRLFFDRADGSLDGNLEETPDGAPDQLEGANASTGLLLLASGATSASAASVAPKASAASVASTLPLTLAAPAAGALAAKAVVEAAGARGFVEGGEVPCCTVKATRTSTLRCMPFRCSPRTSSTKVILFHPPFVDSKYTSV